MLITRKKNHLKIVYLCFVQTMNIFFLFKDSTERLQMDRMLIKM